MVKIGYARVSSKWYRNEVQLSELQRQGCDRVWSDTAGDGNDRADSLESFLKDVSAGDIVVVSRLSAVADSIAEVLHLLEVLRKKGAAHLRGHMPSPTQELTGACEPRGG